jgi:hypothetical protein
MAEIRLELDPIALREATSNAIMGTLTPELREKIIRTAISQLLNAGTGSYGSGPSQLERAFGEAVSECARQEAKRLVAEDESIKAKMKELLADTAKRVLDADPDKLAQKMADAFVSSMRKEY